MTLPRWASVALAIANGCAWGCKAPPSPAPLAREAPPDAGCSGQATTLRFIRTHTGMLIGLRCPDAGAP